jgi:hypothetical protein
MDWFLSKGSRLAQRSVLDLTGPGQQSLGHTLAHFIDRNLGYLFGKRQENFSAPKMPIDQLFSKVARTGPHLFSQRDLDYGGLRKVHMR